MTKKEELIVGILKEDLKSIKKLLKEQEKQLNDIRKNGMDPDIHKAYRTEIQTGLSYTIGYCTGHIKSVESSVELLGMTDIEIEELIAENKRISAENKKHLDEVFGELKKRVKKQDKTKKKI